MLPLQTEATIEAMNISTDRRHPGHTYNNHNLFRHLIHTTKHRSQHRRRREGHENLEWEEVFERLTPLLHSMLLGDFDNLMAG